MPSIFSAGSASVNIVPDFKGAQQRISQWFAGQNDLKVGVQPDLDSGALTQVKAQFAAQQAVGRNPELKVDIDQSHLLKEISKSVAALTGVSEAASKAHSIISPSLFAGGILALGQVAAAAGQAGGALALLPAGVVAAVAPIAVLTIGMQGLGTAFSAFASGDAAAVQEALDDLAPAARSFVTQMHELGPAFHDLRLDVQQQLFIGMGDAVSTLAERWLPTLTTGLSGLATEMRQTTIQGLAVASSIQSINDGALTFRNLTAAANELNPIMGHLVAIWRDFATVGSAFLPGLAHGLNQIAESAARWTASARESGQLTEIIARGLSMIGDLFELLVSVARVLIELFRPAIESGTTLINLLTGLLHEVADFLALDTSQSSLRVLFEGIKSAVEALMPAFMALVELFVNDLAPAFGHLLTVLAPVVNTLFVHLAEMLHELEPLFPIFTEALIAVILATEPLIPVFTEIIRTILPVLAELVTSLAPLLLELAEVVGHALLDAVKIIAPFLPVIAEAFVHIMEAVFPLLPVLLEIAITALPPLVEGFTTLLPPLVHLVEGLLPIFVELLRELGPILPQLIQNILDLVTALLPLLSPLVSLVSFLLPPIILMFQFWAFNIDLVVTALVWFVGIVETVVRWLADMGNHLVWLKDVLVDVAIAIRDWAIGIRDWVVMAFREMIDAITGAAQVVWGVLQPIFTAIGDAWTAMITGMVWFWDNILHPIWDVIAGAAIILYRILVVTVFGAIALAFGALVMAAKEAWEGILRPVWEAIQVAALFMWNSILKPTWDAVVAAWNALGVAVKWVNDTLIQPTWNALQAAVLFLWNSILKPTWDAITVAWNALGVSVKWINDNIIQPTWNAIQAAVEFLWNSVLNPIWEAMKAAWDAAMRAMRAVYDTVLHPMWTVLTNAVNSVKTAFEVVVAGIKTAWDSMMYIVATPINFIIEIVFNKGLFTAWNWVIGALGLPGDWKAPVWKQLPTGQQFEEGGRIPGTGTGDIVPIMAEPGEFMVQKKIATKIPNFLEALNAGQAEAVQATGGFGATGPVGHYATGGVVAATDFARAQNRKPYIWGGVGPTGYDCSGFMSAITNVLRGQAPHRRLGSTGTMPWSGFQPGTGSAFALGHFKGNPGHTAGTLAGNNVESGGSPSMTKFVTQAAGALNFAIRHHLPEAGGVFSGAAGGGSAGVTVEPPWYVKLWNTVTGAFTWLKDSIKAVAEMGARFGDNAFVKMVAAAPGSLVDKLWSKIKDTVGALFASGTTGDGNNTAPGGLDAIKGAVQSQFATKGWGGGNQWAATDWLVQKESSWNPSAQNPTSTASGLFQHIDGTWAGFKPAGAPSKMRLATISQQAFAGMGYIGTGGHGARPFRDPLGAKSFHMANGWYDGGGWLPPGISTVFNGTGRPEPVLSAAQNDNLNRWKSWNKRGRNNDRDGRVMGDVHIHHERGDSHEIMDALWHRIRVAKRGGVFSVATVSMAG